MAVVELKWVPGSSRVVVVAVVLVLAPLEHGDRLVWPPQPLVPTLLVAPQHETDPAVSLDRRCPQTVFDTWAHGLVNLLGKLRNRASRRALAPEIS